MTSREPKRKRKPEEVTLLERDFKEKPGGNQQSSEMADIIAMGLCLGWMDYSGEILSAVRFLSSKNCPSGAPSAAQRRKTHANSTRTHTNARPEPEPERKEVTRTMFVSLFVCFWGGFSSISTFNFHSSSSSSYDYYYFSSHFFFHYCNFPQLQLFPSST